MMDGRRSILWRGLGALVLALALLGAGFAAGVTADRAGAVPGGVVPEPTAVARTFGVFWQAWDLVEQRYVDRSALDPKKMTYGAIAGLLDSLGDTGHTRFLTPDDLHQEQETLAGRLEGIGAQVDTRNGQPTIVAPLPGSPAQKAGLRPGDVIVRVDGRDVAGASLQQVVGLVRGPEGTRVTLTVIHDGETTLTDVTVTREQITIQNVTWARVPGTTVAHVVVSQFGERASADFAAALQAAQRGGATSIILDLRSNPGGILDEAVGIASQFVKDGDVLIRQDAQGRRLPVAAQPGGVATSARLAVLINEGTASAAEIVAGAIQDHQRGPLVGATTFGTGTVLSTFNLSDGSAILLGTEEWLTPSGRRIWHQGIAPDIRVSLAPTAEPLTPAAEAGMTAAQWRASGDAQLLRALDEVTRGP